MNKIKPQTLKGFRDFLPREARKRQFVSDTLKGVFTQFGFEPLETPVLEYEEILAGKYGEEGELLMYRFEDNGKRRVAMRYDQTVPLARVIAQYQNELAMPFKRYQIQPVWRAENTQKGRYREFVQCDIDTVGVDSALADAEIIATALKACQALGFKSFTILINDRSVFDGLSTEAIVIIDKLKKIGEEGVCQELAKKKIFGSFEEAQNFLRSMLDQKPTQRLSDILKNLEKLGISKDNLKFSPTLARGLDYYTGLIFEIETPEYPYGSLCGGGRYNNLIGMFSNTPFPAVGCAFGFDRTLEAMEALNLFPANLALSTSKVLISIFSPTLESNSLDLCAKLRANNINAEIYLGEIKEKNPLERQLKYAIQKGIPYLAIIGPEEAEKSRITLKNLQTREQKQVTFEELLSAIS
jgi:histidyl-tRNA synthetase